MKRVYALLGFDVEHDAEPLSEECRGIEEGLPKILDLLDDLDVRATFNILACLVKDYREEFLEIKRRGHEIGSHSFTHDALSLLPDDELEEQIKRSTEEIERELGKPLTFRAPYLLGDTRMINILDKHNYRVDSSLSIAHCPSQILPFHPSKSEWTENGDLNILEVPVCADPEMDGIESDIWPGWRTKEMRETERKINSLLKKQSGISSSGVIAFYLHPWEFVEMKFDLPDQERLRVCGGTGEKALNRLKEIIRWLKREKDAEFLTMSDFREAWIEEKSNFMDL